MIISQEQTRVLRSGKRKLVLGIVTQDGNVLLREASSAACPGHAEWLKAEPRIRAKFGFSLISQEGKVQVIMRASRLNPPEEGFLLPQDVVDALKRILPVDEGLRCYGH